MRCIWSACSRQTHAITKMLSHAINNAKTNFLHSSYLDRLAKTSENDIGNALFCVIKFMKTNEKEMWNSTEVHNIYSENRGYKLNRRSLKNTLKNHFSDLLVVLLSPGASISTFRKSYQFRLQNIYGTDDKDVKDVKLREQIGHFKKLIWFKHYRWWIQWHVIELAKWIENTSTTVNYDWFV